ncbi:hypothetical protein Taro_046365 [Colocasia esculenta]|uniref:Uncharacterized protein n=1 Tax=Colocasia esculenta TaxID=4460 RepID=A0A843WZ17_COLES|nr:hypothetical protein [Colocasia esculenta]
MVKKAQMLEDATDFTDRIKGKFVKKEMASGSSVSTQSLVVSTLDPVSRSPSCLTGTVCRHSQWQCRH